MSLGLHLYTITHTTSHWLSVHVCMCVCPWTLLTRTVNWFMLKQKMRNSFSSCLQNTLKLLLNTPWKQMSHSEHKSNTVLERERGRERDCIFECVCVCVSASLDQCSCNSIYSSCEAISTDYLQFFTFQTPYRQTVYFTNTHTHTNPQTKIYRSVFSGACLSVWGGRLEFDAAGVSVNTDSSSSKEEEESGAGVGVNPEAGCDCGTVCEFSCCSWVSLSVSACLRPLLFPRTLT